MPDTVFLKLSVFLQIFDLLINISVVSVKLSFSFYYVRNAVYISFVYSFFGCYALFSLVLFV